MLIREFSWDKIRAQFTEGQKRHLRRFITGQSICPRGWLWDEAEAMRLIPKLAKRFVDAYYKAEADHQRYIDQTIASRGPVAG